MILDSDNRTICALSTGRLPCAIAGLRLSGPATKDAIQSLTQRSDFEHGYMRLCDFSDRDQRIDTGYVVFFSAPRSYTGQDCAELFCHGSPAVVQNLLRTLCQNSAIRLAQPGEFTRRAVMNGKKDLCQAQGVLDLINAETVAQMKQAHCLANGVVSSHYQVWRAQLIEARARIEACLEFPDETEVFRQQSAPQIRQILKHLADSIASALQLQATARSLVYGYRVAIVGKPNVGKSSLLNTIADRKIAIVASTPGTTRDAIRVRIDLDGLPVEFIDTAGIRQSEDEIEQQGIAISQQEATEADLVLLVADLRQPSACVETANPRCLPVFTHLDCMDSLTPPSGLCVSNYTGAGFPALLDAIRKQLEHNHDVQESALVAHQFQLEALQTCQHYIALSLCEEHIECQAECLRLAAEQLGKLVGGTDIESTFDALFKKFCIGK